jgi:hypothetical protein
MSRCLLLVLALVASVDIVQVAQAQNLLINGSLELESGEVGGRNTVAPGWEIDEGPNVPEFPPGPRPDDWAPSELWVYEGNYNNSEPMCDDFLCHVIDAADYTVWRDHLGQNFPLPNRYPFLTGPVDPLDYSEVWKKNFGGPNTMSLAEPTNFSHTGFDGTWNLWFQPYSGSFAEAEDNWVHLTQTVAGSPGVTYTMKGWAMFEPYFAGGHINLNLEGTDATSPEDGPLSPTDTFFAMDFLDSAGELLRSEEIELMEAGQPTTPPDFNLIWHQHTLSEVAPAGTASVRVRVTMLDAVLNPGVDPQSFFVDQFELTASAGTGAVTVPEPAATILAMFAAAILGSMRPCVRRWQ